MAKVYNLSDYLRGEKSKIVIGDESYEIDNGFDTVLMLDELQAKHAEMTTREFISTMLGLALGDKVAKDLIAKNYPTELYMNIISSIQDSIQEESIVDGDSQGA